MTDYKSRLVEPWSAWLQWKFFVSARRSDDLVVSVQPYVLGFEGICNNGDFLDSLCDTKNMDIFELQAVRLVLEFHWNDRHFVFTMLQLVLYILLLGAFQSWLSRVHGVGGTEDDGWSQQTSAFAVVALAGVFILQEIVQIIMMARAKDGPRWAYFKSGWNIIDLGCHSLVLSLTLIWLLDMSSPPSAAASAVAGLLAYAKLLSYMRAFEPLSALVAVLAQVVKDAMPFLTILLIALLGFASAMHSSGEFPEPSTAVYKTFLLALNSEIFIEPDEDGGPEGFATLDHKLLQVTCLLFASVVMMNLLIAVISDSFERVQEKKVAQFLLGRAQLIRDNNLIFDFFNMEQSKCRWLHVMQSKEGSSSDRQGEEWSGRLRALKKRMVELQKETHDELQVARTEQAEVRRELQQQAEEIRKELQHEAEEARKERQQQAEEARKAAAQSDDTLKRINETFKAVQKLRAAGGGEGARAVSVGDKVSAAEEASGLTKVTDALHSDSDDSDAGTRH